MDTVVTVLSYRMPGRTNRTVRQLIERGFTLSEDLFVFENDTKGEYAGDYVTNYTGSNLRMTGGFNYICDWLSKSDLNPKVVWMCTNDFDIEQAPNNLKTYFAKSFIDYPSGSSLPPGWVHPVKTVEEGYAYPWMHKTETKHKRAVWMTDFICPVISWQALRYLRADKGYWFDPRFYRGWGIDYDTCYQLRRHGLSVSVDENILISHKSSETYTSGKAPESKDRFYSEAHKEMTAGMEAKYGKNWYNILSL